MKSCAQSFIHSPHATYHEYLEEMLHCKAEMISSVKLADCFLTRSFHPQYWVSRWVSVLWLVPSAVHSVFLSFSLFCIWMRFGRAPESDQHYQLSRQCSLVLTGSGVQAWVLSVCRPEISRHALNKHYLVSRMHYFPFYSQWLNAPIWLFVFF